MSLALPLDAAVPLVAAVGDEVPPGLGEDPAELSGPAFGVAAGVVEPLTAGPFGALLTHVGVDDGAGLVRAVALGLGLVLCDGVGDGVGLSDELGVGLGLLVALALLLGLDEELLDALELAELDAELEAVPGVQVGAGEECAAVLCGRPAPAPPPVPALVPWPLGGTAPWLPPGEPLPAAVPPPLPLLAGCPDSTLELS